MWSLEVEILVGPMFCGKTEYAESKRKYAGTEVISAETFKRARYGGAAVFHQDGTVWQDTITAFKAALNKAKNKCIDHIILDSNFVTRHAREQIYNILKQYQVPLENVVISYWSKTPLSTCLFRNASSEVPIDDKYIIRQFKRMRQDDPYRDPGIKPEQIFIVDWREKGGDDRVTDEPSILPDRILSPEPTHSSSSSNNTVNCDIRVHQLDSVESSPEQINPYTEFVLRAREVLGADSKGNFRVWPTLKVRWFSHHLKGGEKDG